MLTVLKDHSTKWTLMCNSVPNNTFIIHNNNQIYAIPNVISQQQVITCYENQQWIPLKKNKIKTNEIKNVTNAIVSTDSNKFYLFTKTAELIIYHTDIGEYKTYQPYNKYGTKITSQIQSACINNNKIHAIRKSSMLDHWIIDTTEADINYRNNTSIALYQYASCIIHAPFIDITSINANGVICMFNVFEVFILEINR